MEEAGGATALDIAVKVIIPVLLIIPVLVTASDYLDHGRGSGRGRHFCMTLMLSALSALLMFTSATVFFGFTWNPIAAKHGWPVVYPFVAIPWIYLVMLRRKRLRSR